MSVVTLLNQKGGVGKSTTTFHLGGALAKAGRTVLLVDNDPQSSLTQGAIGTERASVLPLEASLAAIYSGEPVRGADLIIDLDFPGLHLLPNTEHSTRFNLAEPHLLPWESQAALVEMMAEVAPSFDIVLIDCPPNLYLATWAALAASDSLIIPVQAEDYGIQGLVSVERSINLVRATVNPRLGMLGLVITMFGARKSVHQAYEAILRETYGDSVFSTCLPHAIDFPEATMHHRPLSWHKPKSASTKALAALADEFMGRIEAIGRTVQGEAA
jgi:chromosome partitioning protein